MSIFGNNTPGGAEDDATTAVVAVRFTAPGSGVINSYSIYTRFAGAGGDTLQLALYASDGTKPTTRLEMVTQSAAQNTGGAALITIPAGGATSIVSGTEYWLAVGCVNANGGPQTLSDSGAANQLVFIGAQNSLANPFGTPSGSAALVYSIYATYTPSGGGGGAVPKNNITIVGTHRRKRRSATATRPRVMLIGALLPAPTATTITVNGTASSVSTARGAGAAVAAAAGISRSESRALGAPNAVASGVGQSLSVSRASGAPSTQASSVGAARGTSTAAGSGSVAAMSTGSSLGTSSAFGTSSSAVAVTGNGASQSTAQAFGAGSAIASAVGAAHSPSSARGAGSVIASASGDARSPSTARGAGTSVAMSAGMSLSLSSASSGVLAVVISVAGFGASMSTAIGVGTAIAVAAGIARSISRAFGTSDEGPQPPVVHLDGPLSINFTPLAKAIGFLDGDRIMFTQTIYQGEVEPWTLLLQGADPDTSELVPYDVSSASALAITVKPRVGDAVISAKPLTRTTDGTDGLVGFTPSAGETATAGIFEALVVASFNGGIVRKFPGRVIVKEAIV